jgi:hypothetical protein
MFLFHHDNRKMGCEKVSTRKGQWNTITNRCAYLQKCIPPTYESTLDISIFKTSINVHSSMFTFFRDSDHSNQLQCLLLLCNSPLFSSIHFDPFFR